MELDTDTLASREDELTNKESELEEREGLTTLMENGRDDEIERFEAILQEHEAVRDTLFAVREIINERLVNPEASFLETSTSAFATIGSKLRSFKGGEKGFTHGYSVMF